MANDVRLIDANALTTLEDLEYYYQPVRDGEAWYRVADVWACIDGATTIDPKSLRPKGRWEKYWCKNDLIGHMYEVCPNCRSCEILDTDKFWDSNFCPNCGADMRES